MSDDQYKMNIYLYMLGPSSAANTRYYIKDEPDAILERHGGQLIHTFHELTPPQEDAIMKVVNHYKGARDPLLKKVEQALQKVQKKV